VEGLKLKEKLGEGGGDGRKKGRRENEIRSDNLERDIHS